VVSGQVGLAGSGLADGFGAQLDLALENLHRLIESEGATLSQVTKTTVFLVDMSDYDELNQRYVAYFDRHAGGHRPARSAVAVRALPLGALVEIEAWVHAPS
jgi:2-iminobutanoate/2-iminopropanoate deaminase